MSPRAERAHTCQRIIDVVPGAFRDALPDRVIGAANGANATAVFTRTDQRTGNGCLDLETLGGGMGGRDAESRGEGRRRHEPAGKNRLGDRSARSRPRRPLAAGDALRGAGLRRAQPGEVPRDRVHPALRATRGDVTALWSTHGISGYDNVTGDGRFGSWVGHDLAVLWRNVFGIAGLDLTGGVMNVGDRGPPADSADRDQQDASLEALLGRTFFVRTMMAR